MKVKSPGCGVRGSQLAIHKCLGIAKGLRKRQQCRDNVGAARLMQAGGGGKGSPLESDETPLRQDTEWR